MPGREDKVDAILAIEGGILSTNKMEFFSYKSEHVNVY